MSLNLVHERSAFEKLNKVSANWSVFQAIPRTLSALETPKNHCCSLAFSISDFKVVDPWINTVISIPHPPGDSGGCSHVINICFSWCTLSKGDWKLLRRQLFISKCWLRWIWRISQDYSNFAEIAEKQHYLAGTFPSVKMECFIWLLFDYVLNSGILLCSPWSHYLQVKNSNSIEVKCFQSSQNKNISVKIALMFSTLWQFHFCSTFCNLCYYSCLKEQGILACWYVLQIQQPSSSAAHESNQKNQSTSISLPLPQVLSLMWDQGERERREKDKC